MSMPGKRFFRTSFKVLLLLLFLSLSGFYEHKEAFTQQHLDKSRKLIFLVPSNVYSMTYLKASPQQCCELGIFVAASLLQVKQKQKTKN